MTMNSTRKMGVTLAALVLMLSACDDKVVQPNFGSGCNVGSLSAGSDVSDSFDDAACVLDYHPWSGNSVAYATYSVNLTKGKGYHFYAAATADAEGNRTGQRIIGLYGKSEAGQSVPLAISSSDAGGPLTAAEFFFIAPRSGTFNLVVSNYDVGNLGGYRVTMDQCPVLGTIDTNGSHDFVMPTSSCVRRNMAYTGTPSQIALIGIEVLASATHNVSVTTGSFTPYFEFGGPDFDIFGNVYGDADYNSNTGSGNSASIETGPDSEGMLTLAVGSDFLDATGEFTVNLTRTPNVMMQSPLSVRADQAARPSLGLTRTRLK